MTIYLSLLDFLKLHLNMLDMMPGRGRGRGRGRGQGRGQGRGFRTDGPTQEQPQSGAA